MTFETPWLSEPGLSKPKPLETRAEQKQRARSRTKQHGAFKARIDRNYANTGEFARWAEKYHLVGSDFVVLAALVRIAQDQETRALVFDNLYQLVTSIGWPARQVYYSRRVRKSLARWASVSEEVEEWYTPSSEFAVNRLGDTVRRKGSGTRATKKVGILRFREGEKLSVTLSKAIMIAKCKGMYFLVDPDVLRKLKYRTEILLYMLLLSWSREVSGRGFRRSMKESAALCGFVHDTRRRTEAKIDRAIERINEAAGTRFVMKVVRNRQRVVMCAFEKSTP